MSWGVSRSAGRGRVDVCHESVGEGRRGLEWRLRACRGMGGDEGVFVGVSSSGGRGCERRGEYRGVAGEGSGGWRRVSWAWSDERGVGRGHVCRGRCRLSGASRVEVSVAE